MSEIEFINSILQVCEKEEDESGEEYFVFANERGCYVFQEKLILSQVLKMLNERKEYIKFYK